MNYPVADTGAETSLGAAEYAAMHARLDALSEGNAAFVDRCFHLFVQETTTDLAHLDAASAKGDDAAVVSIAHRLKGACLTSGAAQIAACCAELELEAREGAQARVASALHRLAALFQAVCRERMDDMTEQPVPIGHAGRRPTG
jgi:HPt (histidine-containing phosphotransfer) domain-containing protein